MGVDQLQDRTTDAINLTRERKDDHQSESEDLLVRDSALKRGKDISDRQSRWFTRFSSSFHRDQLVNELYQMEEENELHEEANRRLEEDVARDREKELEILRKSMKIENEGTEKNELDDSHSWLQNQLRERAHESDKVSKNGVDFDSSKMVEKEKPCDKDKAQVENIDQPVSLSSSYRQEKLKALLSAIPSKDEECQRKEPDENDEIVDIDANESTTVEKEEKKINASFSKEALVTLKQKREANSKFSRSNREKEKEKEKEILFTELAN